MLARLTLVIVTGLVTLVSVAGASVAAPKPVVVTITVKTGRVVGGVKRPSLKKGMVVKLVVVADRGESFHVHGYRVEKLVKPGKATVLQFTAKIPGRFDVELHHPDILLASITVNP